MSQEAKKTKPKQISIIDVKDRYELMELVMAHVESSYVRRVFQGLDTQQVMKLMFELARRVYYTDELEMLIHRMFIV